MRELVGRPVIDWVVARASRARTVDQVIVATTTDASDNALAAHCIGKGHQVVRGSSHDVLDRIVTAAAFERADIVVRLYGNAPLIDPGLVDEVVRTHLAERRDYTTNRLPEPQPGAYPPGLEVEVASMAALTEAWMTRSDPHHRETVTAYLYESPGRFNVRMVSAPEEFADVYWAVATYADLAAVGALIDAARALPTTSWRELLGAWRRHPEIAVMNERMERSEALPAQGA